MDGAVHYDSRHFCDSCDKSDTLGTDLSRRSDGQPIPAAAVIGQRPTPLSPPPALADAQIIRGDPSVARSYRMRGAGHDPAADRERATHLALTSLYSLGGSTTEARWRDDFLLHGGPRDAFADAKARLLTRGQIQATAGLVSIVPAASTTAH